MVDLHAPICCAGTVWFAGADALKGTLGATLQEVRPTVFLGVPRVWEKIMEKMQAVGAATTGLKKSIATWAKEVGLKGSSAIMQNADVPWGWWLANKLVFGKVRVALGLDRCHFQAVSAAPMGREQFEYFMKLNIPIFEAYGMSECTGMMSCKLPNTRFEAPPIWHAFPHM